MNCQINYFITEDYNKSDVFNYLKDNNISFGIKSVQTDSKTNAAISIYYAKLPDEEATYIRLLFPDITIKKGK